jgi:hypothetical protein
VEGYYKHYDREPVYSIVPDPADPSAGTRRVEADGKRYGKKRAYGVEMFVHKKKLDKFYYQISYSLFSSKRRYTDGEWYDDDHNFRNAAKMTVGSNLNKSHRLSGRLDITEGNPYTPIDVTASEAAYSARYDIADGWNAKRRDPRFKLSLRYDYTLYLRRMTLTSYVEVQNLLNQQDIVMQYYSLGGKFPEGEVTTMYGRGILPVGGMTITF